MPRIYNFGAGPAVLPEPALKKAAEEMLDWHGSGTSVMEMSHRGKEYGEIITAAETDLRQLLAVPPNYRLLFLHGGATLQFAAIPMNLLQERKTADYVNTGEWSQKAIKEAKKYCAVNIIASSEDRNYSYVPGPSEWKLDREAAYVHYTANETIGGVEFHWIPHTGNVPLVADMSSNILSRPIDVSRYGLIYAGAQKNIGPAGLAIVIVRDDLIGKALDITPIVIDYKQQAENGSMLNTPPTYSIYVAGLVFQWLKELGGLKSMEERNRTKAALLYDFIDGSDFYRSPVAMADRSLMNVPFRLADEKLDEVFLKEAKQRGLLQLKGHRLVGGMRASIYNAMPIEGVRALIEYMREFATKYG